MRDDEIERLAIACMFLLACVFAILYTNSQIQQLGMAAGWCYVAVIVCGVVSFITFISFYNIVKIPICQTCNRRMIYIQWYQQYFCYYCGTYNQFGNLYNV